MNVFVIPSWYPSPTNPLAGIFFREQATYLAEGDPSLRVGVSLWGQSNNHLALTKDKPLAIPQKIRYFSRLRPVRQPLRENLVTYFHPTLVWTRMLLKGNLRGLLQANRSNLTQFVRDFGKADLIHAHVAYPGGYLAMHLAQEWKVPFVLTEHMGPFPFRIYRRPGGKLSQWVARPLRAATRTIAVSPSLAARMVSFGLPRPIVIPNMVDEDFFFPPANPKRNPAFTFLTMGSIEESKGMEELLRAFRLVVRERPELRLRIGGDGSKEAAYQALTKELGLQDQVAWLGRLSREQARAEHRQADAFVLPSHYESFGVVFAEAIACGKPVLATRCGGPESIVNETNGLLCEVGDVPGIARRILEMVEHRERYDRQAIRADFMGRFSKRAVVPQVLGVYREVVRG
jgi:glycosyltransferase involved in cell wall biosynthesis